METKNMLYLVTEYASNGEMFGMYLISCVTPMQPDNYASGINTAIPINIMTLYIKVKVY